MQIPEISSYKILIVEDERVIARDIRLSLENLGYTVSGIATSGAEAIAKVAENRPNLVLMDIRLGGEMDGIQAANYIWRNFRVPAIYATGYSDKQTLERAKATGPFGYLLKPIEERELFVAIETALQRYQLDIQLYEREEWLTKILKGIGDGVIVVDIQLRVKFLNSAAEVLIGCRQSEVQDHPLTEVFQIVHEETQLPVENPVCTAIETGNITFLPEQTLLITRTGPIPIADSAAPLRDEQGVITGAVLVFRDITERQLARERTAALNRSQQLQEQMLELERLSQLKDDFLSTISHELRTPLANIKVAIRLLEITLHQQADLEAKPTSNLRPPSHYLEILRDQCDQELRLINTLLDYQRLNAGAYTLELETIQLADWMAHIVEGFQGQLQARQLQLQLNLDSNIPTLVSDITSLNRILTELLNNACKYTPPGEQITIMVSMLDSERVQLNLCNSGVEIPPAELSRIFEPFYRIPKSDRWGQGGTGLGLSLVEKLITNLGGIIQVESGSQQTCFMIELPISPRRQQSVQDL